ncbi:phosphonate ABC transporter, permease protein PhnE [Priestia filamentosa]|uniref:phosphonate ABC transporter, permease protein PhnE n=1 Tax=Priestia filamentosa TaxID=1402861 RepID=UPI001FB3F0F6|nr:phosphonate ABC transporter, permease protein PhnE [Priestia filamentosa]MED3726515.1 phosphonate ABC transporter, permease protein PhnE [Priestia filamentosa]
MKTVQIKQNQTVHYNKMPSKKVKHILTFILLLLFIYLSGKQVEFSLSSLATGLPNMGDLIVQMVPPNWAYFSNITAPILDTLRMAVLGTTFGALLAIPIALLSARNIFQTKVITIPARFVLNLIRTIPDLLLAAIFVAIFGIGPIPGVFALTGFSLGIIAKLIYESIESIDKGPLEAMTAVGANKVKWIMFGVIPQVLPQYISFVLYTFEVNVRAAAVLGLVGAGGIGLFYEQTLGFFEYDKTSSLIVYTLIVVLIIDYISTKTREKLI